MVLQLKHDALYDISVTQAAFWTTLLSSHAILYTLHENTKNTGHENASTLYDLYWVEIHCQAFQCSVTLGMNPNLSVVADVAYVESAGA